MEDEEEDEEEERKKEKPEEVVLWSVSSPLMCKLRPEGSRENQNRNLRKVQRVCV